MDIKPGKENNQPETFTEPAFVEPEAMAAAEDAQNQTTNAVNKSKSVKWNPLIKVRAAWKKINTKQRITVVAAAILLLGGGAFGLSKLLADKPVPAPEPVAEVAKVEEEPPKPTTEASKLTGVQISPELNARSITAVMIENSVDARPQAGLKDAGVIFEAIAEGGITRFVAFFQEAQPDYIGPVRSARPYYIDWLMGFDAAYVHAGGSGEALALIRSIGVKDIEHGVNGGAFQRVSNRYAPHNLYTTTAQLDAVKAARGYTTSNFTPLLRATEAALPTPTTNRIDLNISSALYAVHYDYIAATNSYNRVLAGKPHTDERSGVQLSPKAVVALVVPYSIHPDRIHSVYSTLGSGKAYIFQNGSAVEGTWTKPDRNSQIVLKDAAGADLGLVPGQTWFTAVASANKVTFLGP